MQKKNNNKIKISLALATFNEEKNISDCLNSAKIVAQELVVVDGQSEDKTAQIASNLGAKVIITKNHPMFHINKNLAINNCEGEWILLMDADERITPELAKEIKNVTLSSDNLEGYWINRRNWFLGGYLKKGGVYPDNVIRLFKNGKGHLPEKSVHEQVQIKGRIGHLKNDLLHFADPNFSRYLDRANRYTTQTATEIDKKKPGLGIIGLMQYSLIIPCYLFVKIYFRHKGFQDGFRGFVWALFSSFHFFYAYTKYWETSKKIENIYDRSQAINQLQ